MEIIPIVMKGAVLMIGVLLGTVLYAQENEGSDSRFSEDNEIVRVARLREAPELKVMLFPNPCFGEVTVSTASLASVLIFDETGREAGKFTADEYGKVYADGLLTGVYYVVVVSEKRRALTRLVVL